MFRTLTFSALTVALLSMTPSASAYFAEDFALPASDTTTPIKTASAVTLPAVSLPALDAPITRAQFTAMVIEKLYSPATIDHCYWDIGFPLPPRFTLVFSDVSVHHPYAKHLCIAMRDGLIRGYGDGTFRPDALINAAESAKILTKAFGLAPYADTEVHADWVMPYVRALTDRNAFPLQIRQLSQPVTVIIAQEMFSRLQNADMHQPARSYEELVAPKPASHSRLTAPAAPNETSSHSETMSGEEDAQVLQEDDEEEKEEVPASERSFWDLF